MYTIYAVYLSLGCSTVYAWDTTNSSGSAGCPQISANEGPTSYNISMEFGLGTGLSDNCQMVVISEIERNLVFDVNRSWSLKP